MGSRNEYILQPISDPDGIAESQSPVGAGPLDLNGILSSDGSVQLQSAHRLTITSDGNDAPNSFTVSGLDERGVAIQEVLPTGPNIETLVLSRYFSRVDEILISGAAVGVITVGLNGESVTPWRIFNTGSEPLALGIIVILAPGSVLVYSAEHTGNDIHQNKDIQIDTLELDSMTALSASDDSNYAFPAVAGRIRISSFTSGILTATFTDTF
jgi:hypothetical protein